MIGVLKTVLFIVAVWFIWNWLDRNFGGPRDGKGRGTPPPRRSGGSAKADDSKEGEYVDFEELKD